MPGSMLSTSSVHSIVSLPPSLPSWGERLSAARSESPPPPQPARTAPARANARNAPLAILCIEVPSSGGPRRVVDRYEVFIVRARGAHDDDRYGRREGTLTGRPAAARCGG